MKTYNVMIRFDEHYQALEAATTIEEFSTLLLSAIQDDSCFAFVLSVVAYHPAPSKGVCLAALVGARMLREALCFCQQHGMKLEDYIARQNPLN